MADRTINLDDLTCELDEHLGETDTTYVAALAERICGGTYRALSDGESIRHDGVKHSFSSVILDITHEVGKMAPADAAKFASELLSDEYEAGEDGLIHVTFASDSPTP